MRYTAIPILCFFSGENKGQIYVQPPPQNSFFLFILLSICCICVRTKVSLMGANCTSYQSSL